MLPDLTVFTPNQEYGPETDPKTDSETGSETGSENNSYYDHDDDDSIRSFNTDVFLEACDAFNYCFRCDKLIESETFNKCTCVSEGKLPQNQSCPYCDEKYNDAEKRCQCFCKDCNEISFPADDVQCACEREAEDEFQRSFECKGYNYCYKCCAVIKTNINSTNLCTCIADGFLPHNIECIDCLENI